MYEGHVKKGKGVFFSRLTDCFRFHLIIFRRPNNQTPSVIVPSINPEDARVVPLRATRNKVKVKGNNFSLDSVI